MCLEPSWRVVTDAFAANVITVVLTCPSTLIPRAWARPSVRGGDTSAEKGDPWGRVALPGLGGRRLNAQLRWRVRKATAGALGLGTTQRPGGAGGGDLILELMEGAAALRRGAGAREAGGASGALCAGPSGLPPVGTLDLKLAGRGGTATKVLCKCHTSRLPPHREPAVNR